MEFFIGATFGLGFVNFALSLYIMRLLLTADNRRIAAEEDRQNNLTMRVQAASECKIPVELQNSTNIGLPEATEIPGLDK